MERFTLEEASALVGSWFKTTRPFYAGTPAAIPAGTLAKVIQVENMGPDPILPSNLRRYLLKVRWHESVGEDRFDSFNRSDWDAMVPYEMGDAMATPAPATKKVRIVLGALTRVEYTEVLEVPVDMTEEELHELVNNRYEDVDGSDFQSDPEYWERGETYATAESGETKPNGVARRVDGAIEVEIYEA